MGQPAPFPPSPLSHKALLLRPYSHADRAAVASMRRQQSEHTRVAAGDELRAASSRLDTAVADQHHRKRGGGRHGRGLPGGQPAQELIKAAVSAAGAMVHQHCGDTVRRCNVQERHTVSQAWPAPSPAACSPSWTSRPESSPAPSASFLAAACDDGGHTSSGAPRALRWTCTVCSIPACRQECCRPQHRLARH